MSESLVAGCVQDPAVRQAIKKLGCRYVSLPSAKRMSSASLPGAPRLFLLQTGADEFADALALLKSLRRERPLTKVVVWSPGGAGEQVCELFRAGASDVVVAKSSEPVAKSVEQVLSDQQILPRVNDLERKRSRGSRFESMLSRSQAMWDLFELCDQVASTDATVLIVGETGTGKELLARAIHRRSSRSGRLVAANCASMPAELINSELCGYEKGAFTGADRAKKGLVRHADGGTLFLDEIGDMPLEAQQSLLRILQEKKVRPIGGLSEAGVDVRIVAATNVSLEEAVDDGAFREDLFYRLDVIRMNVPPLRERPEDILFLFGHFAKQLSKHYGLAPPTYADAFIDRLAADPWPGNVRDLQNFAERLVLSRIDRALTARDYTKLRGAKSAEGRAPTTRSLGDENGYRVALDTSRSLQANLTPIMERLERKYFEQLLQQNSGRVAETASQAGVSRRTLLRKMKQYSLDKNEFKPA